MEGGELPIAPEKYSQTTESVGTVVKLPIAKENPVVKVSRANYPATSSEQALNQIKKVRYQERVALEMASEKTKAAIVPQEYVLAEGQNKGEAKTLRVQKFIDGTPFKKIGFWKIMNLDHENLLTLKSILRDSMRCYLKYGTNFDLSGSDERDAIKVSRTLNRKRQIFPLSNSSNLFLTKDGIKLIDPNVLGNPGEKNSMKWKLIQFMLFSSTIADYGLLSLAQLIPHHLIPSVPLSSTP